MSTFDGVCHQTFRAAKIGLDTAESDSDDEEDYTIKRNKFGAPIYDSKPAYPFNCSNKTKQALALQTVINPLRKVCVWKKAVSFLGSFPVPLEHLEWKPEYQGFYNEKGNKEIDTRDVTQSLLRGCDEFTWIRLKLRLSATWRGNLLGLAEAKSMIPNGVLLGLLNTNLMSYAPLMSSLLSLPLSTKCDNGSNHGRRSSLRNSSEPHIRWHFVSSSPTQAELTLAMGSDNMEEARPSVTEKPTNRSVYIDLHLENEDDDMMIDAPSVRDLDQPPEVFIHIGCEYDDSGDYIPGGDKCLCFGNVLGINLGHDPVRQAALSAGLLKIVVSTSVNKVCASGMKGKCNKTLKVGYNNNLAENLSKQIYSPFVVDWNVLKTLGCASVIDEMLEIRVHEIGSDEVLFTSKAWLNAFNINEPIYTEICQEFYATFEFDEAVADEDLLTEIMQIDKNKLHNTRTNPKFSKARNSLDQSKSFYLSKLKT
ncbi:reverse transcriptase domain-containing protein [Tanacetum coccineum]